MCQRTHVLRKIAQIGHPILREQARALSEDELSSQPIQNLIDDMIETMRDANGAGLAATQVYESVQICVIEVDNNPRYPDKPHLPLTILVNPTIEVLDDEMFESYEGCLSVPDLRGVVARSVQIRLRAFDRHGSEVDSVIRGPSAVTFQHECDHLKGVLFVDRVLDPTTLTTWNEFERHHRAAFVERLNALNTRFADR